MTQNIRIGDTDVQFRTSGALPFAYREITGRDFFVDLQNIVSGEQLMLSQEMLDFVFVMHRYACPDEKLTEQEWLEQFEFADLSEAIPAVIALLMQSQKTTSESKKKADQ